jgi:hypothetical protein
VGIATIVAFIINTMTCGLYYRHFTIVNDDTSIFIKWRVSLTDDARVIIYDHNLFIIQAIGAYLVFLENDMLCW